MNRKITLALLISVFFTVQVFAATGDEEGSQIPQGIRNNEFYLESLRLSKLAQETFDYGDYDASAGFAEEAIRYTQLSNEYVASQLLSEAKRLMDWADSNNIAGLYPSEYYDGKNYYEVSVTAHSSGDLDKTISAAIKEIEIFSPIEALLGDAALPSQYTVRPWASSKDCLWNIAGYSWVYGEPEKWRVLYDANKAKLPDPNNPNLIEPGMVLDIPSISGEVRRGMWDANKTYTKP